MIEIRIHGRGGQGSVTLAELIAEAVFFDGKFSQGFPNFGVERRGAPVTAFVRIDKKFIRLRSQIYEPDFVMVQDPTLPEADVFSGLKKTSQILINSEKKILKPGVKIIPATELALQTLGRPIINTVMLGAFAALSGLITLSAAEKAIKNRFTGEMAEKNILALKKGFEYINDN